MGYVRSCLLIMMASFILIGPVASRTLRFYSDDPIHKDADPLPVHNIKKTDIYALYDYLYQTERQELRKSQPASGVNTLGEVPDNAWFTNRHGRARMTRAELRRGAGDENAPQPPFVIVGAKTEGITSGFRMLDSAGRLYFVKSDPVCCPELATGSEIVGSKFFYAIGYNTPENYIVKIRKSDLSVGSEVRIRLNDRLSRKMTARDLDDMLEKAAMMPDGSFRVVASLAIPGRGLGPFRYEGTRSDDPNDLVPHQDRRDLRGLFVFCAWLNHTDAKGDNSYDSLVQGGGIPFVRHYLLDFGSALGSDGDTPKDARFGHEYQIPSVGKIFERLFNLGLYPANWERAYYSNQKAVGRIESQVFDPQKWKTNYPNPAFLSRRPDDEYWAAKIVLAFSDEDIRTLVETGKYSDPRTVESLTNALVERRDQIGRCYLPKVLPLENFGIQGGKLVFEDIAVRYQYRKALDYRVAWYRFDNEHGSLHALPETSSFRLPDGFSSMEAGRYLAARIYVTSQDRRTLTVFLRKTGSGADIVGLEREWR
jgi:hypothetical protein